jgi:septal ring factor EnvC (AmiA/AmiB activator)
MLDAMEQAKIFKDKLDRAKHILTWLPANLRKKEEVLALKLQTLKDLQKDIPELQLQITQHANQLTKVNAFIGENADKVELAEDAVALQEKITKLTKQVAALQANLDKVGGNKQPSATLPKPP